MDRKPQPSDVRLKIRCGDEKEMVLLCSLGHLSVSRACFLFISPTPSSHMLTLSGDLDWSRTYRCGQLAGWLGQADPGGPPSPAWWGAWLSAGVESAWVTCHSSLTRLVWACSHGSTFPRITAEAHKAFWELGSDRAHVVTSMHATD